MLGHLKQGGYCGPACCFLSCLSPIHGADITIKTDILPSPLQSPVVVPESEALTRKVSCKLLLRQPREVSVCVGQSLRSC